MGLYLVRLIGKIVRKLNKFDSFRLNKNSKTVEKLTNQAVNIGKYSYGKPRVFSWGEGTTLTIGKFCSIAGEVSIFLGGNHRTDWISTYPFNVISEDFKNAELIKGHPISKGNVLIGNDVWIGYGATILSGVSIGDGAVIGAYSVVSKNVEPYEVIVGNPAYTVKKRFDDETIEQLLKIRWWDWPSEKINSEVKLMCSTNISEFISKNFIS